MNHYQYYLSIYLITSIPDKYETKMYVYIRTPVHVKDVIYVINAREKLYLREKTYMSLQNK